MKARLTLGTLGISILLCLVAPVPPSALGAEPRDALLQTEQKAKQHAVKEPSSQEGAKAHIRAQLELLELQKRQVQDQMKELVEQLEEQTSEQIKQLREQTEAQIKQLKEQADEQMKQLKQRAMRLTKQWQVQAQRQYELLEAQQRLVFVQGGMQVSESKGQAKPSKEAKKDSQTKSKG